MFSRRGHALLTFVDNARVELNDDGVADDLAEEARGVLALVLAAVLHGCEVVRKLRVATIENLRWNMSRNLRWI